MTIEKQPRLKTEWNEIEPAVFERKGYSPEQAKRLSQRPNELIKSALRKVTKNSDENDSGR